VDRLELDWPIFEGRDIRIFLHLQYVSQALRRFTPTAEEAAANLRSFYNAFKREGK